MPATQPRYAPGNYTKLCDGVRGGVSVREMRAHVVAHECATGNRRSVREMAVAEATREQRDDALDRSFAPVVRERQ
jgi:hypothetical protein